jgi:predicted DNA binding CopG/RHH family protein
MSLNTNKDKVKNLKISVKHHEMLKKHCKKKGLKMFHYIESLIEENCKVKKDIYGES